MTKNVLTTLVERQSAKYGDREAIYRRTANGEWLPISWNQLATLTRQAACALEILGLKEGARIAEFSANDCNILIADFAAFANRAVPVSIYSTSSEQQVEYIVRDAEAEFIFTGDQIQYEIARSVAARCPVLRRIITLHDVKLQPDDTSTMTFEQLLRMGENASEMSHREIERRTAEASADDIATLLYTSGTTGEPKGAILPHSCFNAVVEMHHRRLSTITDADTSLSFLPLSHIFEKAWTFYALDCGIRVYVNSDPREIQTALREVHPTVMCSVPRFWEKAYSTIQDKMARMKPLSRWMCAQALKAGRRRNLHYKRLGLPVPMLLRLKYNFFNDRVFRKVKKIMGVDKGHMFPTAGAPIASEIVEFFRSMDVPIVIGYGLSETTATVTCYPDVGWEIGTIGTPLEEIHVKIGADNEILVKAPTVMRGYYKKPEETAKAFTPDGFFRTGDAGYINPDGSLVLTERIKDLFKTSNGKYIAPQAIESRLGTDPYIEQVAVIGDNRKFVTAIIVPAIEAIKEYAQKKKIQYQNLEELVANNDIRQLIAERIDALQEGLASFEKIKRFTLLPREFSMELGELTNTLKLRRPIINKHFASQIEQMYSY